MSVARLFDVTIVGELNLDLILSGLPEELPPERELLATDLTLTLGSSSAITAHNLAILGSRVGFISRIADDPMGAMSLERLAASGVDVSRVKKAGGATPTGLTVILPHANFRNILTYPGTMHELCFEDLDLDYLSSARHFHLSSFFLHRALLPNMVKLFTTMKNAGLSTSLDINDDPEDRWDSGLRQVLPRVDVFFLNERELTKVAGEEDFQKALEQISRLAKVLVVKRGAKGALARRGSEELERPAAAVEAVDPVGAGDSFNAGFLHRFVQGADLASCLEFGNLAGAFSTTRPGGTEAFRNREHFEQFFSGHRRSGAIA
ncbi:MAG: carbohydrate kinase family protein [Terriglobia bacterium]